MKKFSILFVAVLFAVGMSAKIINLWRTGIKTEITTRTNDSITFDTSNTPTMRIWRNGEQIYNWALQVDDSITYAADAPASTGFDYDHWREQQRINIYGIEDSVSLPWDSISGVSQTAMPKEYRHPNMDMLPNGEPQWQLAFNLCDVSSLPKTNIFGLWDSHAQKMRIYEYIETELNDKASSCFLDVRSDVPVFVDEASKAWMPSTAVLKKNWDTSMADSLPTPSDTICQLLPITGSMTGEVYTGWICFELNFSAGIFDVAQSDAINIRMDATDLIKVDENETIQGTLQSYGGKLTIPGNKTKKVGGILSSIGNFISSVASFVMQGSNTGGSGGEGMGIGGIAGAAVSCAGGIANAIDEGKTKTYGLEINFNVQETGQIKGTLTTTRSSVVPAVTMQYRAFFDQILKHSKNAQNNNPHNFHLGIWNLKNQPVYYVSKDYVGYDSIGYNPGDAQLLSFLDPNSIQLELNTDNTVFPFDEIDTVRLLAYDFVFTDSNYTMPAKPYYDFYKIACDSVQFPLNQATIKNITPKASMLDPRAECVFDTVAKFVYAGAATQYVNNQQNEGLQDYNMIYSPSIWIRGDNRDLDSKYQLNNIGVVVIVEMVFKDGDKRIFADRFLPEIVTFSAKDAPDLLARIMNSSAPNAIEHSTMDCPLFNAQKNKAIRLLDPIVNYSLALKYPIVPISNLIHGIRLRNYQDDYHKGIIISTAREACEADGTTDNPGGYGDNVTLLSMFESCYLDALSEEEKDNIDKRLIQLGMTSLRNNNYYCLDSNPSCYKFYEDPDSHTSACDGDVNSYIHIYIENMDGSIIMYPDDLGCSQ